MIHATATAVSTPLPSHWQRYYQSAWAREEFLAEETPYFGTKLWVRLSERERQQLAVGFMQINAEVIIHLEQGLLVSAREMRRRGQKIDAELAEFIHDEIVHIDVFRDYLQRSFQGRWREHSLLLFKRDRYRRFCAWLYRWEPLCVFLPGAKSELYAVQYHQALRQHGVSASSQWGALVKLHAEDEASHIRKDFALLRDELSRMGPGRRLKLVLATLLCVLMTQWSLLLPTWRLVSRVFRRHSLLVRIRRTLQFVGWVLWVHPAFPSTRKIFRRLLAKESDRFFKRFAFLGW